LAWTRGHYRRGGFTWSAATPVVQRGSNENTNGLVRQYLPKGTELSGYSQEQLDLIADEINMRPRKGLGVRCPLAVYRELLVNHPQHSTLIH
jgi:IS30 family transposase